MKSNLDAKWKVFTRTAAFENFTEQEKSLCAATVAIEVAHEIGLRNVTRLPDEIEDADALWLDKYEIEKAMKNLSNASTIDINKPEMQAAHAFLLENNHKSYNEILDELPKQFGDDLLTNIIKQFIPSVVLNLKLLALNEHIEGLYSVRDVEDIKDSIEERLPEEFRRLYTLMQVAQEESTRLFGLFVEAKGKLYFLAAK